jgi:hypothetical protein
MIGRVLTLGLCALAFWAGMQFEQARATAACEAAGGAMRGVRLCAGVAP